MYKILEKSKKYSDYPEYLSDHPETLFVNKTVSSRPGIITKIVLNNKTYSGIIDGFCNDEAEYLLTCSINSEDFKPEKIMMLNLQIPTGETLCITCNVKWFLKHSEDNKRLILGMKIIGSPFHNKKLMKDINSFQH